MATREPAPQIERLARLAQTITGSLDLPEILDRIARGAAALLPDSVARLWVAEHGRLVMRTEAGVRSREGDGGRIELAVGEGLTGTVAATRTPLILEDVRSDPRLVNAGWAAREGLVSFLGIPLLAAERLIGVLAVITRQAHAFSPQELEVFGAFADQAAVAFENARLHAASVRRGEELAALLRSTRSLMAERDLPRALDRILDEAARIAGTPTVHILLLDRERRMLRLAAARGGAATPGAPEIPLGVGLSGVVAETGRSVYSDDVGLDPRHVAFDDVAPPEPCAYLGLPIRLGGDVLGVLAFFGEPGRRYGDEEVTLLESFADHVALAIENADLNAAVERRLHRLQTLTRLNRLISSSLDTERLLREITSAAAELMDAATAAFWVADEATRTLRIAGVSGAAMQDFPPTTLAFGEGLAGAVARERRALNAPDVFTDGRRAASDWWRAHGQTSFFGVPVVVDGGALIAVLALTAARPFVVDADDTAVLESFTAQAAVAIRNAGLFATSERRRSAAESLAEVGRALAGSLEPDVVAQRIAESVQRLLGGQSAGLNRADPDGDLAVVTVAGAASGVLPPGTVLPRRHTIAGLAVRERGPVTTPNFLEDPRIALPAEIRAVLTPMPYRAMLAVPLILNGRAIGALWVGDVEGRVFDEEEIRVVQTFADQAALALRNADLLHDARTRQSRLEALVELSRHVSGLQPLPALLSDIARACGELLDSASVGFRLREGDELVATGAWGDAATAMPFARLPVGLGLVGIVAATGEALHVADVRQDPRVRSEHRAALLALGHRAWLGVPVKVGERVLGVLTMRTPRPGGFSEADVAVAGAFASQAAVAIENARLYEEADRRRREAEALARLAQSLTETLDADAVGRRIADSLLRLFGARFSTVRLLVPDGSLAAIAWAGEGPPISPERPLGAGMGVTGAALAAGRPAGSADVLDDPHVPFDAATRASVAPSPVRAILSAPMRLKGAIIGAVSVGDTTGRVFDAGEHALIQTFADEAALALQNARLFGESERRRRGAEALLDIARALGSTLDLDEVLRVLTQRTAQAVGADRCLITLWRGGRIVPLAAQFADGRADETDGPRFRTLTPQRLDVMPGHRRAIEDKRAVVVADVKAEPVLPAAWRSVMGQRALLIVPLLHQDTVIGTLDLDRTDGPYPWTQEQIDLALTIANQAALAVENARLFAAQREEVRVFGGLLQLARAVEGVQDLDELLETIARITPDVLGLGRCGILLYDPGNDTLVGRAASGFDEDHRRRFLALHAAPVIPAIAEAIHSREPVAVTDVDEDTWFPREVATAFGVKSLLVLPLVSRDTVVGVMLADREGTRTVFSETDLALARGLAAHAAVAIDRVRLFAGEQAAHAEAQAAERGLQTRVRQQEAVATLGQQALAGGDLKGLMDEVTAAVARTLGVEFCNVFELLPDGAQIRLVASHGYPTSMPEALTASVSIRAPAGVAVRGGESVIVEDLATDERFPDAAVLRRFGVTSGLVVPIAARAGTVGALSAYTVTRREFSRDDVHFLQAVGHVLAAALERQHADEALRASEAQFRQSQKMEAVGRLAGGVAHDFNNLLTIITGRTQLLLAKLRPADPLRRDLDLIDKTALRGAGLTRQLLAFSRKQVLAPKVLDLNGVVAGMASMLMRLLGEDVELVIEPGQPLAPVRADQGQLEQVVVNLAVNARDAMPRGGRLTLSTANVVLDAEAARRARLAPGPYVGLLAADTGTGMDEATASRIFEPFFTTKPVGQGTGLGLSTVYGIVQQHQGAITVETAPGAGTTFAIYLPPTDVPVGERDGAAAGGPRRGTETILLVEDEDEVRALAHDILEERGYTVLDARTPSDAVVRCDVHPGPIALMLTDVIMPGMSGPELAAAVAERRPAMKVLYMSGYTDDFVGPRGLASGIALLQKPFTPAALAARVREILDDTPPAE